MPSLGEVVADAVEHVDDLLTCSCHDKHVKNNIEMCIRDSSYVMSVE